MALHISLPFYVHNLLVQSLQSFVQMRPLVSYYLPFWLSCLRLMVWGLCQIRNWLSVWWREGTTEPFDPAEHESTGLCVLHQKASLHGLTLVGCIHPRRTSLMLDQTHKPRKTAALQSPSLSLLVALCQCLFLFLIIWHFERTRSFSAYDSAVSKFSFSRASARSRGLRSLYSAVMWQRAATCHAADRLTTKLLCCSCALLFSQGGWGTPSPEQEGGPPWRCDRMSQ